MKISKNESETVVTISLFHTS